MAGQRSDPVLLPIRRTLKLADGIRRSFPSVRSRFAVATHRRFRQFAKQQQRARRKGHSILSALVAFVASTHLATGETLIQQDVELLQAKARRVFGAPPSENAFWSVQPQAIQQSTPLRVAALKAGWFGPGCVVDICCGLGGDLLALARRGPAVGIDADPNLVRCAKVNLAVAGLNAEVRCEDVLSWPNGTLPEGTDWIHVDPDRRADGRRHTRPDDFVPSWTLVRRWLDHCRGGLVKLAPATDLSSDTSLDFHRTWISLAGSVREQTCIAGECLDHPWCQDNQLRAGQRSAIVIKASGCKVFSADPCEDDGALFADPGKTIPHWPGVFHTSSRATPPAGQSRMPSKGVGRWLIDPDSAIRASGLTTAFARNMGCRSIAGPAGFLTSDLETLTPQLEGLARHARVLEVVPAREKKIRAALRTRDAFAEVVKARGSDLDPARLQRQLRDCGTQPVGVWIGRSGKGFFAAITTPPK